MRRRRVGRSAESIAQTDAENVELLGHIGGITGAIAVCEPYLIINEGDYLTVLDVSNPASPAVVGKTKPWSGTVSDIHVSGGTAYVAAGDSGLWILDISDPAHPTALGVWDEKASKVYIRGTTAYVVGHHLSVVDVSRPDLPGELGYCSVSGGLLCVNEDLVYLTSSPRWPITVDVSNPVVPSVVPSGAWTRDARDIHISGYVAYVIDRKRGLYVFDVRDPRRPTELGSCDVPGGCESMCVRDNRVYVGNSCGVVRIFDVSDPARPSELGSWATTYGDHTLAVSGRTAYVAVARDGRLWITDVTDPTAPKTRGVYDKPGVVGDVDVSGGTACVAADERGLLLIDVDEPTRPIPLGQCRSGSQTHSVVVSGDFAYVLAVSALGVSVVDISNRAWPTTVGYCGLPGRLRSLSVSDETVYVIAADGGFHIVDVSDQSDPFVAGYCDLPGHRVFDLAVSGGMASVVGRAEEDEHADGWLRLIDVSDPTRPVEIGSWVAPGCPRGVCVSGDTAYVVGASGREGWLQTMDLSDPTRPAEIGRYDVPGRAWDVGVSGHTVYVAEGKGLRVVDASDPGQLTEVGCFPSLKGGVTVSGDLVYVAGGGDGLFILRYSGSAERPSP